MRLSGAKVIVAAGPELDGKVWALARRLAAATGARALLALRPTGAGGEAPALEPLAGTTVAYLATLAGDASPRRRGRDAPGPATSASYIHTGGTTGTPKLAARTHRNEVANAWMVARVLEDDDVVFAALPLFHTNAIVVTLLAPLLRGVHVVWAGPLGYRDPSLFGVFWKLVERHRIAVLSGVPTVYAALAEVPVDADISSLRMPIVGAAPLPPAVAGGVPRADGRRPLRGLRADRGHVRHRVHGPRRRTAGNRRPAPAVPAGPGGADRRRRRAGGGCCRTARSARWSSRARTSSPAISSPGRTAPVPRRGDKVRDGWLDTGDLGSVDADGYIRLAGRAKDLIIRGGHNIDPAVIEDALLEHPAVRAAAAVGRPDAHAGEVPVAYVALAEGAAATAEELRAWAAGRVPEPAAAPKRVDVIDAIPVTEVGKPFKPELRRRAAEDAARDALAGRATAVTARLDDGQVVITVQGADDAAVQAALGPFALAWESG